MKERLTSSHKTNPIAPHPSHWQKLEKPISKQSTFLCCYQTIKGVRGTLWASLVGLYVGEKPRVISTLSHCHIVTLWVRNLKSYPLCHSFPIVCHRTDFNASKRMSHLKYAILNRCDFLTPFLWSVISNVWEAEYSIVVTGRQGLWLW